MTTVSRGPSMRPANSILGSPLMFVGEQMNEPPIPLEAEQNAHIRKVLKQGKTVTDLRGQGDL